MAQITPRPEAAQVPSSQSGMLRIAVVTSLPYLRSVDSSISEARYKGRRFDRNSLGGGFVEETAYVDTGVFISSNSMVLQRASVFYNPDSASFVPETMIIGKTVLSGNAKILWRSYLSNARVSGNMELSDVMVCGNPWIRITGDGKLIGAQNLSEGDIRIAPTVMMNNVSLIGRISITGNGIIGHLTKTVLDKMVLELNDQKS
jgi:hypothetical protein